MAASNPAAHSRYDRIRLASTIQTPGWAGEHIGAVPFPLSQRSR